MGEEKRLLQIGGLTGLPAGILWIIGAIGVAFLGFVLSIEELLLLVQESRTQFVAQLMVFLIAQLLTVLLFLALYRVSRNVGPTRALVGAALGVAGALLFVTSYAISVTAWPVFADLHAVASPEKQTIILIALEVVNQISDAFQLLGFLLIGVAFIFGWALLARAGISKGYGWAGVVLGGLVSLHGLVGLSGGLPLALIVGGFGGLGVLFLLFG